MEILPPLPIVNEGDLCLKSPEYLFPITNRKNEFGHRQLQVMDILNVLTEFLPKKGYSVLGMLSCQVLLTRKESQIMTFSKRLEWKSWVEEQETELVF